MEPSYIWNNQKFLNMEATYIRNNQRCLDMEATCIWNNQKVFKYGKQHIFEIIKGVWICEGV